MNSKVEKNSKVYLAVQYVVVACAVVYALML